MADHGKEEIMNYMKLVGLAPDNKKGVKKYSLGMKQRLGLVQALMENPDILILDEPFNGLDKNMSDKIKSLLMDEKKRGKTILLVSHTENDIWYLCDRTYGIDKALGTGYGFLIGRWYYRAITSD